MFSIIANRFVVVLQWDFPIKTPTDLLKYIKNVNVTWFLRRSFVLYDPFSQKEFTVKNWGLQSSLNWISETNTLTVVYNSVVGNE